MMICKCRNLVVDNKSTQTINLDLEYSPSFGNFTRFWRFRQVSEVLPGFGSFAKNLVSVSPETLVLIHDLSIYNYYIVYSISKI
jgi:hypothetical protein